MNCCGAASGRRCVLRSITSLSTALSRSPSSIRYLPLLRASLVSKWRTPITYNRERSFTTQESPSPMASIASGPSCSLLAVPPQMKRKQDDFGLILEDLGNQPAVAPILAARKRTVKDAINARMDIYNYAATMLAVPKYSICCEPTDRTGLRKSAYYSTIELPEFGIKVEGRGSTLPEADCLASIEFYKAMSRCRDRASLAAKKNIFDFNATAKEILNFLKFYELNGAHTYAFKVEKGGDWRLEHDDRKSHSARVFLGTQQIGSQVNMPDKLSALKLAELTAAVHIAKNEPLLLVEYLLRLSNKAVESLGLKVRWSMKTLRAAVVDLTLSERILKDMQRAFGRVSRQSSTATTPSKPGFDDLEPLRFDSRARLSSAEIRRRSSLLKQRHYDPQNVRRRASRSELTMNDHRQDVLEIVEQNPYSIIVGATGSGKTTQVPQIILDAAIERGEGARVNIICVQPRRIAASSVARRVAFERGEKLKDTVGYHVRFDPKLPRPGGSITFCTTGVLLKQLQYHADSTLDKASHIILDEVHERDISIDFIMASLKTLLETRKRANKKVPKVVLMSATIDTTLFANYFGLLGEDHTKQPCPSIQVPGRMYPVKELYLEDIMPNLSHKAKRLPLLDKNSKGYLAAEERFAKDSILEESPSASAESPLSTGTNDLITPISLVGTVIAEVARKTSPRGAILAFLPGIGEILEVERFLTMQSPLGVNFGDSSRFQIFKLHSSMRADESQQEVFDPPRRGCRKIILSTNIAETSITIPDAHYVIDTGQLREKWYDQKTHITQLQCSWVSKSSSRQRAGRAGRVQNGYYYALFSKARFDSFDTAATPEMLRSDLQEICLDVKNQFPNTRIEEFLASAIEPPWPGAVQASIHDLKDLEALTPDERLTPLGRLLASLPVHSSLGKMIVLGIIFRCLDPMLILGAAAGNSLFLRPVGNGKLADLFHGEFGKGHNSDSITVIEAFRHARRLQHNPQYQASEVHGILQDQFLNARAYVTICRTMEQCEEVLVEAGAIPDSSPDPRHHHQLGPASLNINSGNFALIKALTIAGFCGNIARRWSRGLFNTEKEGYVMVHPSSTNSLINLRKKSNESTDASPDALPRDALLSYSEMSRQDKTLMIRETNLVTPLMVALFGPKPEWTADTRTFSVEKWLKLRIETQASFDRSGRALLDFRYALDEMLSAAFDDLSRRKFDAHARHRDEIVSAAARIVQQDQEVQNGFWSPARTPPSSVASSVSGSS